MTFVVISALALSACDDTGTPGDGGTGTDAGAACEDASGAWQFDYTCGTGAGGFQATVTQIGCAITLVQMDDRTPMTWTSTGTVASDGGVTLSGELGFTADPSCTGALTGGALALTCGECNVMAMRR